MSADLFTEAPDAQVLLRHVAVIDGREIDLADCDWLQFAPCGCPNGIQMAKLRGSTHVVADEDAAWLHFTASETKAEVARDRKEGFTVRLVTHDDYKAVWAEKFKQGCIHDPKWGLTPTPIPEGYEWGACGGFRRRSPYKHLVPSKAVIRDRVIPRLEENEGKALCGSGERWAVWYAEWHNLGDKMECSRCAKKAASA